MTIVAIGITIFLLVKVVPVFGDIFSSFGGQAARRRRSILIKLSNFMKKYSFCFILAGGGIVGGWLYYIKTRRRAALFGMPRRIKLPIFGIIAHKICLARFTRTMASLVRSGVPILEVLSIVQNTVGNVVMEKAIKTAAADIERGRRHFRRAEQASRFSRP